MRKSLWIMLAVLLVAVGAPNAHADTTSTFDVSGTAKNVTSGFLGSCASEATCSFSGTLTIDVTTGAVTGADLTFPGVSALNIVGIQSAFGTGWDVFIGNNNNNDSQLLFTTAPTPGSLIDFTGGNITSGGVIIVNPGMGLYDALSGSITPATTAAPEPSSVALMLLGVGSVFVLRKRIGQRLPQAS